MNPDFLACWPSLQTWWQQRIDREKAMLLIALALVSASLVWAIALAPALQRLHNAAAQGAQVQAQLQAMRRMQAQALALQAKAPLSQSEAAAALSNSVLQAFGASADITVRGSDAQVSLRNVSAEDLAQWLAAARTNARAVPLQARLVRNGAHWSGSLQLGLPAP